METTHGAILFVESLSYWGIAGMALIANTMPFIPEEVFILVSGYLVGHGTYGFATVMGILIAGLFLSDMLIFSLARRGNRYLTRLCERFFKQNIINDHEFIRRHAIKIVFFSRFIVQLRVMGPVLGGLARVPWRTFILYDLLALLIYVPIVMLIGDYFGSRIQKIVEGIAIAREIAFIVIGILIVFVIFRFIKKRFLRAYSIKERVLKYFNDAIEVTNSDNS